MMPSILIHFFPGIRQDVGFQIGSIPCPLKEVNTKKIAAGYHKPQLLTKVLYFYWYESYVIPKFFWDSDINAAFLNIEWKPLQIHQTLNVQVFVRFFMGDLTSLKAKWIYNFKNRGK